MNASVTLRSPHDGYHDEVIIEDIRSRNCFSYLDNSKDRCEMRVFDDGLCFFKKSEDHLLELHLHDRYYARITTDEGIIEFDIKAVDFTVNNDILVMHYIVNDEAKIIEIKYY